MGDHERLRALLEEVGVENDAIFDEFRRAGATVVQEPINQPWAYEMKFEDIDGNVLWLGTAPDPHLPRVDA